MSAGRSRPGAGGGASSLRASDPGPLPRRGAGERPKAFTCYLCGMQYGSASLLIHIPQ